MKKKIHFWVPYPEGVAPSQRFRVEQYLPYLSKDDISYKICPFLTIETWKIYHKNGFLGKRIWGILRGFFRRVYHLFISVQADFVVILREASPIGPPFFEWLLAKIFRRRIIFDFDDAIWIPGGEKISWIKRLTKATWKIKHIIRWSYKVSVGNNFLANYARQYNPNVILLPTVIDTSRKFNQVKNQEVKEKILVGWTGSHTTLHNLEIIEDVIPALRKQVDFDFLIICNEPPNWNFNFIFKKWEAETEIEDLLKIDVGVMPLKKGPWFEGKCGFKLIQYLACGIPAVASGVGVNSNIVLHGKNGFIADTPTEWMQYLRNLIDDQEMRFEMGKKGRDHIVKEYSLEKTTNQFIGLFK